MTETYSFGEWIKERRKRLRFTQLAIAALAYCSVGMLKKIEADERRPSVPLAESLASALRIPPDRQDLFIASARGELPVDLLNIPLPGEAPVEPMQAAATFPAPSTPFIGRSEELAQAVEYLSDPDCRLLTVWGLGGVGKTRLVLQAAAEVMAQFPDGVVFVPLTGIAEPAEIPLAVSRAAGLLLPGQDPLHELVRILRRRRILLVLDNFEQLIAGASLLSDWLSAAPGLKLVVTSRERLQLQEEWVLPLEGFSEADAEALFTGIARRSRPGFSIDEHREHFRLLFDRVGGLPFAVELAAGWVRYFSLEQISERLRTDPAGLKAQAAGIPERHRSLQALFDSSWAMLGEKEQQVLEALSVLHSSFDEELVKELTGASLDEWLDLVDKSLIVAHGNGRFNLHELTRRYAANRLQASGRLNEVSGRLLTVTVERVKHLVFTSTADRTLRYDRLEADQANIQYALQWGEANGEFEAVLRIISTLYGFWLRRGHWPVMSQWHRRMIEKAGSRDSTYLCFCLLQLGSFSMLSGDIEAGKKYYQRAVPMAHRLEDPVPLAFALTFQAIATDDAEKSAEIFAGSMSIFRKFEDQPNVYSLAAEAQRLYGDWLMSAGRLDQAAPHFEESLSLFRRMHATDTLPYALGNLGRIALKKGRLDEAFEMISESVEIARSTRNRAPLADWLFRLGLVRLYRGETDAADEALREAFVLFEEIGSRKSLADVMTARAEVQMDSGELAIASARLRQAFRIYTEIGGQNSAQLLASNDFVDSLVRAAVLAGLRAKWIEAATLVGWVDACRELRVIHFDPPFEEKLNGVRQALDRSQLEGKDVPLESGSKELSIRVINALIQGL